MYTQKGIIDVTKPPYNVDNTGKRDCTKILCKILDDILLPNIEKLEEAKKKLAAIPDENARVSFEIWRMNGNDYVIFPIRKFPEYFDIVANFRVKKSGSGYVAKKDIDLVKQNILAIYPTAKFIQSGKKLYVEINEPFKKDKLIIKNYTYQLSKQSSNYFEVRRLSNTYNMNVIFAIKLIKAQDENDLIEFKSEI